MVRATLRCQYSENAGWVLVLRSTGGGGYMCLDPLFKQDGEESSGKAKGEESLFR